MQLGSNYNHNIFKSNVISAPVNDNVYNLVFFESFQNYATDIHKPTTSDKCINIFNRDDCKKSIVGRDKALQFVPMLR